MVLPMRLSPSQGWNTGSTPGASKTFQPQRCGLISITVIAGDSFEFERRCQFFVGTNAGSSGDFADSLAVFAAPKRVRLKSHIRLSGVLVKSSLIPSPDVSTHLRPG